MGAKELVKPRVIFLAGTTASGKTDIAIELAHNLACEIVSVDASMVYKGLDIGSAKPSAAILMQTLHRLVDIREPQDSYSVGNFCVDAQAAITQINAQGKIALLTGGSMMYFHALEYGLAQLPPANPQVRAQLQDLAAEKGWEYLHSELIRVDPQSAQRIHANDTQRLQRALEVYQTCGKTLSQLRTQRVGLEAQLVKIHLDLDKDTVNQRIEQRFDKMLDMGLVDEVKQLFNNPQLHADLPAIKAVNYRQVWQYLAGELTHEQMRERAIIATRQLAKRQRTWMRSWQDTHVCINYKDIYKVCSEIV
jgi:tRNA dimethylallyltransferase